MQTGLPPLLIWGNVTDFNICWEGMGSLLCTVNDQLVFSKQLIDEHKLSFHKFLSLGERYFLVNIDKKLLLYDLADIEKDPHILKLGNISVSTLSES